MLLSVSDKDGAEWAPSEWCLTPTGVLRRIPRKHDKLRPSSVSCSPQPGRKGCLLPSQDCHRTIGPIFETLFIRYLIRVMFRFLHIKINTGRVFTRNSTVILLDLIGRFLYQFFHYFCCHSRLRFGKLEFHGEIVHSFNLLKVIPL